MLIWPLYPFPWYLFFNLSENIGHRPATHATTLNISSKQITPWKGPKSFLRFAKVTRLQRPHPTSLCAPTNENMSLVNHEPHHSCTLLCQGGADHTGQQPQSKLCTLHGCPLSAHLFKGCFYTSDSCREMQIKLRLTCHEVLLACLSPVWLTSLIIIGFWLFHLT